MCIARMDQRWYGGRQLAVAPWDGITDFQVEETDQEREQRLQKWETFIADGESAPEKRKDTTESSASVAGEEEEEEEEGMEEEVDSEKEDNVDQVEASDDHAVSEGDPRGSNITGTTRSMADGENGTKKESSDGPKVCVIC